MNKSLPGDQPAPKNNPSKTLSDVLPGWELLTDAQREYVLELTKSFIPVLLAKNGNIAARSAMAADKKQRAEKTRKIYQEAAQLGEEAENIRAAAFEELKTGLKDQPALFNMLLVFSLSLSWSAIREQRPHLLIGREGTIRWLRLEYRKAFTAIHGKKPLGRLKDHEKNNRVALNPNYGD
ncbi:MAG TPA: hypothetical protein VGK00_03265 [Anaerolineales bacterium]